MARIKGATTTKSRSAMTSIVKRAITRIKGAMTRILRIAVTRTLITPTENHISGNKHLICTNVEKK